MKKLMIFLGILLFGVLAGCNTGGENREDTFVEKIGFVSDQAPHDKYNRNIYYGSDSFNFHGQLETTRGSSPTGEYDDQVDARKAQQMRRAINRLNGVERARTVVTQHTIVIDVIPEEKYAPNLEQRIRDAVERIDKTKEIQINGI